MQRKIKLATRRLTTLAAYGFFFATLALLIGQEYPVPGAFETKISRAVGAQLFDFVEWTLDAWREKAAQIAVPLDRYLSDNQRSKFVLDFMQLMRDYWQYEAQVRQIYAKESGEAAATDSADLRAKRDAVRAEIEQRRPTAEAIIQQQISSVLVDEGFGVGGEVFPPVAVRITPLPYILIVSPRDEIRRDLSEGLETGLNVDQAEALETRVLSETNRSALVVPIGGLADYPAMILESTELLFLLQTCSHEWSHHWLYLRPLGYSYLAEDAPDVRTINETVASVFGDEIGLKVMRRFYLDELKRTFPDQVEPKPLTIPTPEPPQPPTASSNEQTFSYSRALHDTRVQVDKMLAEARDFEKAGQTEQAQTKIVAAEDYMEQRRQYINTKLGAPVIRKLNQAYFAFYGAYADSPGAAGSDPVGPNVIALRVYSPTIREFMDRASSVLTIERLQQVVNDLKPKS